MRKTPSALEKLLIEEIAIWKARAEFLLEKQYKTPGLSYVDWAEVDECRKAQEVPNEQHH